MGSPTMQSLRSKVGLLGLVAGLASAYGCSSGKPLSKPTTGAAGAAGAAGAVGTTGAAGQSAAGGSGTGSGGSGGAAGSAAAGTSGAAGQSTAGSSGSGGLAGSGAGGTTGAAGTAGSAGTAGAAGATGAAGTGGDITKVAPTTGCGMDPGQALGTLVRYTMQTSGTKPVGCADSKCGAWSYAREYYVQLPTGYDKTKAYPLLFEGPGCGGKGNNLYALPDLASAVIRVGLSPSADAQAFHATNPGQGCFDDKEGDDSVDWVFYENLYDHLAATVCFDKNRVFAGGNSSGAWLANELGCKYAGDATRPIRGVMANLGGLPTDARYVPTCTKNPMAGFWSWGVNDIGVNGVNGNIVAMNRALQVNGCSPAGVTYSTATFDPFPISAADSTSCKKYRGCPDLTPLVVCPLPGNTHGANDSVVNPGWCSFLKLFSALPVACGSTPGGPVCVPATTRCNTLGHLQTCDAQGQWGVDTVCAISCVTKSPSLAACGNPKIVFTTSLTFTVTNLGSAAGADTRCQQRAAAAGLPGQYKAWLSDSRSSPSKTFSRIADPYVLVNGAVVADNWVDLTSGSLRHAINLTESAGTPPAGASPCGLVSVWSATTATGDLDDRANTCGDWTDPQGTQSSWGAWSGQDGSWTEGCLGGNSAQNSCGTASALYCFQQ